MTNFGTRTYLDHNASAPLLPEARDALVAALAQNGNPSSIHAEGRAARALVAAARRQVAALAGSRAETVVFTSGATEAAATCLTPNWRRDGEALALPRLAVLDTDHPCLREGGRFPPAAVTRLPVDADGLVRLDALREWLAAGEGGLLAFSLANSETGVIQPAAEMIALAKSAGAAVVVDAVQAAGRTALGPELAEADALLLSGHKLGGPKGVGAFVLGSAAFRPEPLLTGGAQETRQRAGTEALPLVAGFGAAAEVALRDLAAGDGCARRRLFEERVLHRQPGLVVLGGSAPRLPQTSAFHHPGVRAETLQIALDLDGFAVSAGSACSSGKLGPSHVLAAMQAGGAPIVGEVGAIRVSFGVATPDADLHRFSDALCRRLERMIGDCDASRAA